MGTFKRNIAALAAIVAVPTGAAGLIASTAFAQVDPFATIPASKPRVQGGASALAGASAPATPSSPDRTGFTGVEQAVGANYAGARPLGSASTAQIRTLPRYVPPIPVTLKISQPKTLSGRPKIAVPTYALALIRQGGVRASAAGAGAELNQRATSISTVLVGVSDDLAQQLADEAHADLMKRFREAGFDVVEPEAVMSGKEMARLQVVGPKTKGQNDWTVYAPKAAPLRSGHPLARNQLAASGASIVLNDVSVDLDAVMVTPYLALDYATYESSGRRNYAGSASVGANLRFRIATAGANFEYGRDKGKGGGIWGSAQAEPTGADEPFGVMFEADDRSDDPALNNAFAALGLGSLYRQSKYYGVQVVPDRYAACVRAAFQGFNSALVDEIKKARAK